VVPAKIQVKKVKHKETKEKLDAKEESKELDKLKKLNDELLKEESTDEKDDKVSANPDSNNVHG
jgi:hypothetical protein